MSKLPTATHGEPIMKMHGCGNDFVVLSDPHEQITPEQAKKICDRHYGIGADGLVTVVRPKSTEAEYGMKFFNPDGSTAEMCGNGIRCFAKYLLDRGDIPAGARSIVETGAGLKSVKGVRNSPHEALIQVDMGAPILYDPKHLSERLTPNRKGFVEGAVDFEGVIPTVTSSMKFFYVSMGNPHVVIVSLDPDTDAKRYGQQIEQMTSLFPKKTNVEFVRIDSPRELTMRVWERGAGETLACGTGACATLVAMNLEGRCENEATIHLLGGDLQIAWKGEKAPVYMTGPARNVAEIDARSIDEYLLSE
jgi:diaminopimelate epimerase